MIFPHRSTRDYEGQRDRLVNAEGNIVREEPGYPYERLTSWEVANVQRLRDNWLRRLVKENQRLKDDLYFTKRQLNQILPLLEEMGINIDVMLATKAVFQERRNLSDPA